MKNKIQKGMAHLLLLVGVIIVAILAIVLVMVFKPDLSSLKQQATELPRDLMTQKKVSPTITPSSNLEVELNSETLTDPSDDFKDVDKDINTL